MIWWEKNNWKNFCRFKSISSYYIFYFWIDYIVYIDIIMWMDIIYMIFGLIEYLISYVGEIKL